MKDPSIKYIDLNLAERDRLERITSSLNRYGGAILNEKNRLALKKMYEAVKSIGKCIVVY